MTQIRYTKAFTLVELLVVIAIIAILMAILMPALSAAKKQAYGSVCLGNQKGLILAYVAYTIDNDDKIPSANTFYPTAWNPPPPDEIPWARAPMTSSGTYHPAATDDVPIEERFNGIRKGSLYPYTKEVKLYHCPGDQRHKRGTNLGNRLALRMYRSYGIQAGLNGEELHNSLSGFAIKRLSEIKHPGSIYVFVEEYYDGSGANYNAGSWLLDKDNNGQGWWNIMAVWHGNSSTLSFADGHTTRKKWKDNRTLAFAEKRDEYNQPDNSDLMYMIKHYAVPLPRGGD